MTTNFELRLARPEDDEDLRLILRENPIAGNITLSFEREPNYFAAAHVEAADHQIVVANDLDLGRIVGMGARSLRPLYLDGQIATIGYLSQFRIAQNYRAMRKGLVKAWGLMKELHQDGKSPFYYTSIIEDNLPARRLLTRGLPGFPRYLEYARMHTLAVFSRRRKKAVALHNGLQVRRGNEMLQEKIIACLQRNLSRYQFAPFWNSSTLFTYKNTPGLSPADFSVVTNGEQVVGCLALWDQGEIKQTIVRGYAPYVKYFRWLINLYGRLKGLPVLPPVNSKIKYAYASHLAVDDDDPQIFAALLRHLYNRAVSAAYHYFMLGLCDHHPFLAQVQKDYAHIDYKSLLYLVTWDTENDPRDEIDDRLPAPEIAIL